MGTPTSQNAVLAPAGWGFPPGLPLAGIGAEHLPDLPLLRFLEGESKNKALVEAITGVAGLARGITTADLKRKYGLRTDSAALVLRRARGELQGQHEGRGHG